MNYNRINWENGTQVEGAYVEIDGTRYPVVMPTYSCITPVTANNLNVMDKGIYDLSKEVKEEAEVEEISVTFDTTHFTQVTAIKMYRFGRIIFVTGIARRKSDGYSGSLTIFTYPFAYSPKGSPTYMPVVYDNGDYYDYKTAIVNAYGGDVSLQSTGETYLRGKDIHINLMWMF